jgi:hypothetical protein
VSEKSRADDRYLDIQVAARAVQKCRSWAQKLASPGPRDRPAAVGTAGDPAGAAATGGHHTGLVRPGFEADGEPQATEPGQLQPYPSGAAVGTDPQAAAVTAT